MTTETVPTETAGAGARLRPSARIRRRPLILGIVGLIVLAVVAGFGYSYYINTTLYMTTDDALVDSNMVSIAPLASGTLAIWRVKPGDKVRAGQVLGQVKPTTGSTFSSITAPIDGTVLRVDGKEGQVVAQAQAIAYVANLDAMRITAYVDESEIHKVHAGQPVEVTVDATGSTVYPGTLSDVPRAKLARGSSFFTLQRQVASAFITSFLATYVKDRTIPHFAHLAEQTTQASPLYSYLSGVVAQAAAQGRWTLPVQAQLLRQVAIQLRLQATIMAYRDALMLITGLIVVAFVLAFFVGNPRAGGAGGAEIME